METSVDTGLIGTIVTRNKKIPLASLLYESVELHPNINSSNLTIKTLRIINPKNDSNTATMKYQQGEFTQRITFISIIM